MVMEVDALSLSSEQRSRFIRRIYGSAEFIQGKERYCLWIEDDHLEEAMQIPSIATRIEAVKEMRLESKKAATRRAATTAHRFDEVRQDGSEDYAIVLPVHSSENRDYLPVGLLPKGGIVSNAAYAIYDADLWCMAIVASRLHLVWVATVCGKLKEDYRYSNTLGWNTFPLPKLTDKNKADLTQLC